MQNIEIKLHRYQQQILKQLTMEQEGLRFNQLLIEGLESEHMNYHLKKLIAYHFVEKRKDKYLLTDQGKDYSNLLDDNIEIIEKQPKTSIIVQASRINKDGETEHLFSKRKRHPYFGKVGRITGKVRFGETLQEAAKRELFEETGLEATELRLKSIYRKMRNREDGSFVQDVFFYIFEVTKYSGHFIEETESQINLWMNKENVFKKEDVYADLKISDELNAEELEFVESIKVAEGY